MARKSSRRRHEPERQQPTDEALQGPPPREATVLRSDAERKQQEELEQFNATSPELSGGDVEADWKRAGDVGEEGVGGSVATPDQDVVDELGAALGVPRAPDEEFRTSQEILEDRDRYRWDDEGPPQREEPGEEPQ